MVAVSMLHLLIIIVVVGSPCTTHFEIIVHFFQKYTLVFIEESMITLCLEKILIHHVVDG